VTHDAEPPFVARWELDLTPAHGLVERLAGGSAPPPNWVETLLHGALITDHDDHAAQVVGTPVGRTNMIGQPVACFAPPDSWAILAGLIVDVAADRPNHDAKASPIDSFMLRGARLKVWGTPAAGISERLSVAVEGTIADDRQLWAVRASEERYRRLIDHLPTALLQVDAQGIRAVFQRLRAAGVIDLAAWMADHEDLVETAREVVKVTGANRSAVELLGAADAEQLCGSIAYLFAAARETQKRVMVASFEGRRSHGELMKLRTLDGRLLDVQLTVTYPTPPERLDVSLMTLEDVTDRLRTEAQLRQLQTDYSRAARIATLGELAGSIAHEVNQPLSAIAMNAETSLRWLSRDEPNLEKVGQLTGRIAESAHHASEIVQRIRGMAGRHVPERVLLDLNEVVEEALLFVRHDIEARAIALSLRLGAGLPPVLADRVQLQQVIVNLFVNCIQAMSQAGVGGSAIEVETAVDADNVVSFAIHDSGPGILPENLDRIFEGFFTTKADGVGIGLAICQSIIVAHGGRITASNHPAGGALFRVTLPGGPALAHD
jgi:C4-dicarboxylate-specific signal transduction histidine kinase